MSNFIFNDTRKNFLKQMREAKNLYDLIDIHNNFYRYVKSSYEQNLITKATMESVLEEARYFFEILDEIYE